MYSGKRLFVMCAFFTAAMAGYAQYAVELPHKKVTVENFNGKAVFRGVATFGKPGQPNLPCYNVTFLLPPGTNPEDVSVSVQNPVARELPGDLYVAPAFPPVSSDKEPAEQAEYPQDMSVYGKNAFFPGVWTGAVSFGKYREYQLVEVIVNACLYNPVLKKVKMLTSGTLVLTLKNQTVTKQKPLLSDDTRQSSLRSESFLKELIANPEALDEYALNSRSMTLLEADGDLPGYAIITTNAIVNASSQLQNLINQKILRGYNVILATENIWGGGTGDAAAENMRTWLKNHYSSDNIQYVLLIGNPHPLTGDVPMKITYPLQNSETGEVITGQYEERPSDFYYAELTATWDVNLDNYFGSYYSDFGANGADKYAEVAVGRIPYYGSITDLDSILAKSISYANATTREWRKRIMLPMDPSDNITPGYELGEAIKTDFCMPEEWNYYRLYDEFNVYANRPVEGVVNLTPPPESRSCTIDNVLNAWTNNTCGLVVWSTHGASAKADNVLESSDAALLSDTYPSMTFQASCKNSWPEAADNLAYSILLNGGITTIGATRNSYYTPGETVFENQGSDSGLAYGYAGRIIAGGLPSADALRQTFTATVLEGDGDWCNIVEFSLYGCPDLALDIPAGMPAAPTNIRASFTSPNAITLNWNDNAASETGYSIERAPRGGAFSEIVQIGADSTTYTDTYNLSDDTIYDYRVRAVNGSVYSLYSPICNSGTMTNIALGKNVVAGSMQTGFPPANAVDGDDSFTSWRAANDTFPQWFGINLGGVLPVSRCELVFETTGTSGDCYDFIIATSVDNVNWTDDVNLPDNQDTAQTQSFDITSPARFLRICFLDAPGTNPAGLNELRILGSPCPSKPVWGNCEYTADNQLALNWEPAVGAVSYTLKRSVFNGGPYYTFADDITTTSFTTSDLTAGITYYFVISANNEAGEGEDSGQLSMTPVQTVPLPPIDLIVMENISSPISLTIGWTDQSHSEDGYNVERRTYGQVDWTLVTQTTWDDPGDGNYSSYVDSDISAYTTYEYRVYARNTIGYSDYAGPVTALLFPPYDLTASLVNNTTVVLTWATFGFSQEYFGIERSTDGINFQFNAIVPGSQTYYNDSTTIPGTTYYYRVYAFNSITQTSYTNTVFITIPEVSGTITIYYLAQNNADTTNQLQPYFKIKNEGTSSLDLSDVTLRYWYTREGTASQSSACDYAGLGGANITSYVNMNLSPVEPALTNANYYLEIGFDSGAGSLTPGQETDAIQIRIWKTDWTDYTQTNDYSFNASMTSFTVNTNITGYTGGSLVFGVLPQ